MTNQEILSIINSVPNAYSMGKVMNQFNLLNEGVEVGVLSGAWTVPFPKRNGFPHRNENETININSQLW